MVDWETGELEILLDYAGNTDNYPDEQPSVLFTCAALEKGRLYLPTNTELFVYSFPELKLVDSVSYPFFHDIHSVVPMNDSLLLADTGLDCVVTLDRATLEYRGIQNVLGRDPWHRFKQDVDYRKWYTTKPHDAHPNYVFELEGGVWATRFNQKDAVRLDGSGGRIDIGVERPHDGHVHGDRVYFTTVNGHIVVAHVPSNKIVEVIDLNKIEKSSNALGWCRGICVEGSEAVVAFSKIRDTAFRENLRWVLSAGEFRKRLPTRLVRYHLKEKRKLGEIVFPVGEMDAIFSVIPVV